ncbi:MAG: carboxypeptidase regulatory-like domain-containing protein [Gemmatimonadota bacterium]
MKSQTVRRVRAAVLTAAAVMTPMISLSAQETGRLVGRVLDGSTGQPLGSAQVFVADGSIGALTALDGRYVLRGLPAGTADITVALIGYATKTITDVEIAANETATLDITVESSAVELEEIVVTSAAERGSTTALMTERRLAVVVQDAIGAEQISRSPDGDAAAALKRVPGLSVVDGKYAYVRGLGERYSATTLNGAPLASPEPDKKVIPLDVIPSALLQSIVTSKSYSPDQPGDYAGGLVQLQTRDFPSNRILNVSFSSGWNSEASFQTGIGYAGGGTDFLGFDNGLRNLPALIPTDMQVSRANFSGEALRNIGRAFQGDWGPTPKDLPLNGGFGFSFGDDYDLFEDQRLGFIASVNYSSDQSLRTNMIERVFAASGVDDPEVDYRGNVADHAVSLGGLANITYQLNGQNQFKLATVYNHLSNNVSRELTGFNLDSNTNQWNTRLQFLEQTLLNTQLEGEHQIGALGNTTFEWRGALTSASRYEPSTREALYQEFGGDFIWDDFIQSGSVFHQDMSDNGWNGGATMKVPFTVGDAPATFSFGGSTDRKDRDAYTRRFRFRPQPGGMIDSDVRTMHPNDLFGGDTYITQDGFEIQEATFRTDNYDATQNIDAGFAMIDLQVVDGFRISGGARVERSLQEVSPRDLWDVGGLDPVEGARLQTTDVLPALNATVALGETMNLRASASQTLARAQLRELAPFSFADYAGGFLVIGNPALDRTRIQNYDLRYEWFGGPQTVFATSVFYKDFKDPIEVSVLPSSELLKTWVNAEGATNYGVEVEFRSSFASLSEGLADLSFNGNVTYVQSEVTIGEEIDVYLPGTGLTQLAVVGQERALQGQSPYVLNLGLTWAPLGGATATVLFNRFGERIDAVGGQATPEILEAARSQLDAVFEVPMRGGWKAKVSASRLLGNVVNFTQGGGLLRSYDLGRSVSLGLSWGAGR